VTLRDLIARLERAVERQEMLPHGFSEPHSYRGYYEDIAFEPDPSATPEEMLDAARSVLGVTFTGYKGGDFKMHEWTDCWIANYGHEGEAITTYFFPKEDKPSE